MGNFKFTEADSEYERRYYCEYGFKSFEGFKPEINKIESTTHFISLEKANKMLSEWINEIHICACNKCYELIEEKLNAPR